MSRPEFPIGVPLPASCIRRIREDQEFYDADPERYERLERERKEREEFEKEQEREYWESQKEGN
jgi:hypothetical protein